MSLEKYRSPILMDNKNLRKINPYIERHFDESKKEMSEFPLENGMVRDTNYIDMVPCPVCGNEETKQWIVKWGGRYDLCDSCDHIFLKNRLKKEILNGLYRNSIANEMDMKVNENDFNMNYWKKVHSKYLEIIRVLLNKNPSEISLLDIGCGAGGFVREAHRDEFNVSAVDIYDGVIEKIAPIIGEKNVAFISSIEELDVKNKYDVITLWGVLEHLPDSNVVFDIIKKACTKDGLFLFLIPQLKSRAFKILGVNTPTLNPRQHINFYSDNSIELVAKKHGFNFIDSFDELPIIDLMWDFIDCEDEEIVIDIINKRESYYRIYIYRSGD